MFKSLKISDQQLQDIIKKGSIVFLFYALNLVLVYFISIFISKYYGPEVYGRYSIIKSLIIILIIIATLGLNTLAIKLSSNTNHYNEGVFKSDFFNKSYLIILFSSIIISVFIFLKKKWIALYIFKDIELEKYLTIFPFLFIAAVFLNYNSNLFKGQGRFLLFSILSSFLNSLLLFLAILVVYHFYSKDEVFLMISYLVSILISFILSTYYAFPLRRDSVLNKTSIKKLISTSFPMMLSSSMIYIIFSIDILMLGFFDTSKNVGIYRIITQIASINAIFVIAFGTVIGPKISKLYSEKKVKEFKNIIKTSSKLIFFITLPILISILLFSTKILLFFGTDYLKGLYALILLSISQFFFAITGLVDIILNMTGHQKFFGKITTVTAVLNLVFNMLLIPKYGMLGAAIATGFSIVLTNIFAIVYIYKKLKVLSVYLPFLGNKTY